MTVTADSCNETHTQIQTGKHSDRQREREREREQDTDVITPGEQQLTVLYGQS